MENLHNNELLLKDLLNSVAKLKGIFELDEINSANELIDRIAERVFEMQNEATNKESEFYTSKQICTIYKISSTTLERWIRSGLQYQSAGAKSKRLFTKKNVEIFKTKKR